MTLFAFFTFPSHSFSLKVYPSILQTCYHIDILNCKKDADYD